MSLSIIGSIVIAVNILMIEFALMYARLKKKQLKNMKSSLPKS